MNEEFTITITDLYRRWKGRGHDTNLFMHYLTLLALKRLRDTSVIHTSTLTIEPAVLQDAEAVFSGYRQKTLAAQLDGIVARLATQQEAWAKPLFHHISFRKLFTKNPEQEEKIDRFIESINTISFGRSAEELKETGASVGYLIEKFSEESFHKEGFLYTPRSLARLMVQLAGLQANHTVYDPACGLGNMLIQAGLAAGVPDSQMHGNEIDNHYWQLCQFNLFFSDFPFAKVEQADSLKNHKRLRTEESQYDCVLCQPPFESTRLLPESAEALPIAAGITRSGKRSAAMSGSAESSFLTHILNNLKKGGKAALIVPHGVLFKSGIAYQVRRRLVDLNLIETVIDLPPNIFYSCKVNASVLVLSKDKPHQDFLFIDASRHFEPDRRRNKMRQCHIDQIVDIYRQFGTVDGISFRASLEELQDDVNDYNLNAKRYIGRLATSPSSNVASLRKELTELSGRWQHIQQQLDN